ncbi:MAG: hypothetical protein FWB93_02810 [Oscillospiraceae bacterium]|nr:hypothetical protein [Oscillospiraceae bacterium]
MPITNTYTELGELSKKYVREAFERYLNTVNDAEELLKMAFEVDKKISYYKEKNGDYSSTFGKDRNAYRDEV